MLNRLRFVVVGLTSVVLYVATGVQAVIIDSSSIVAVRHIRPPDTTPAAPNRDYTVGGISGAGDILGAANSERGHFGTLDEGDCLFVCINHGEDPVVWKRSENYAPQVTLGGFRNFSPGFAFNSPTSLIADLDSGAITPAIRQEWANQGSPLADSATVRVNTPGQSWRIQEDFDPPNCQNSGAACRKLRFNVTNQETDLEVFETSDTTPHGIHFGTNRARQYLVNVNESGFAAGVWNVDNWDAFYYDISEDRFIHFAGGMGTGVNKHKIVLSSFDDYSEAPAAFVAHPDLISEENPRGIIQELEPATLRINSINDENILVGSHEGNPIRMMPTGTDDNGMPTYAPFNPATDTMSQLGPPFAESIAHHVSNGETPFAVGTSIVPPGAGALWNVLTGDVKNLGSFSTPFGITDDGTMAYGFISDIFGGGGQRAAVWMTDDGWENFETLILDDLLAELQDLETEGADLVESFSGGANVCCWVAGINNLGQILVKGNAVQAGALGAQPPVGVQVYLLDTQELGGAVVVKGDVNNDGIVDFLDITPFVNAQSAEGDEDAFLLLTLGGCLACADVNMDGPVDFLDITPFVNLLDELSTAAVPEPTAMAVWAMLIMLGPKRMRKR